MQVALVRPLKSARRWFFGVLVAVAGFALLGTVAAVWENPYFVRMTPVGEWEVGLLVLLSLFVGFYVVIRRPFCSDRNASVGSVLGFVGIACPVCNKILLLAFGSELLLTYFEPVRVYVAALGVLVTAWAVVREWRQWPTDTGAPTDELAQSTG